jgi:hypothetical protein
MSLEDAWKWLLFWAACAVGAVLLFRMGAAVFLEVRDDWRRMR